MNSFTRIIVTMTLVVVLGIAGGPALRSGETATAVSDWAVSDVSRVRLISAVSSVGRADQVLLAVQIKLDPEWKTYWRHPGDAGIPPRFDWSGSDNLNAAQIGWPAPSRYTAFGLETVGYKDEVIFPVTITMTEPGRALSVNLALDYAVCRNICVPLRAKLTLNVPEGVAAETLLSDKIRQYADRIPTVMAPSIDGSGPRLTKLSIESQGGEQRLRVAVRGVKNISGTNVFIAAGEDFGFGTPEAVSGHEVGIAEFLVPVYQYRKDVPLAQGSEVQVTVVGGGKAYEWRTPLRSD